jgi:CDP-paratose 2-epimerase
MLARKGFTVLGIDNDMRRYFFGPSASTDWSRGRLEADIPNYRHHAVDIREREALERIFEKFGRDIAIIVHTAAQPSHDWAAREPITDFSVNANGTMNLLEAMREHCPEAVFIFTSTNKVYGDTPNRLPLRERETRWEVDPSHVYAAHGIDEQMSIDQSQHSLFGASKIAADVLVQEYGRYFGLKTVVFRGGCLTGPGHSGAELHGFLAYLVKCVLTNAPYTVFGYKAKQVRDNIHSSDLVAAFWGFYENPRCGEVYNIGGGRFSNCSVIEAIAISERICSKKLKWNLQDQNRLGDHIWWISDIRKFRSHYPAWRLEYNVEQIIAEIAAELDARLSMQESAA